MTNSAPGFKKYPGHSVSANPSSAHVKVILGGEVIADTREAIELHESMGQGKKTLAPVVYYIPRKDVKMDRLVRTSHKTHCPFKGDASYYSLKDGPENAVWSYEQPFEGMDAIKERLAFYPDKVEIKPS